MESHTHGERPWRVRVDAEQKDGTVRGAGVLLADGHVLTCAHVVGDEQARVTVRSAACHQEWRAPAHVVPDSWVYKGGDSQEGDVALLKLDQPPPCDGHATLWCAPLSQGRVRVHGFPAAMTGGMSVEAELGGDGGHGAQFGLLNVARPRGPWIEAGFSGAGVWLLDGEHAGHVIGIIVAEFYNKGAEAAWMMPTEVIREYLPQVAEYVAGEPAVRFNPPGARSGSPVPDLAPDDTVRVALTQELATLLGSGWAGTAVLPHGGSDTGTTWLVRLVRTGDPAARAVTSPAALAATPSGTVLRLGTVDAAYDAHGKSVAEISHYFSERFGLPVDVPDLPSRLAHRRPPPCLVIAGVDRARSPGALIDDLIRPLAIRARPYSLRLVLGFDGPPPRNVPYDVLISPKPIPRHPPGEAGKAGRPTVEEAEALAAALAAAEDEAAELSAQDARRLRHPPTLPPAVAPTLRVRLAVAREAAARDLRARGADGGAELAGIAAAVEAALDAIARFRRLREEANGKLDKLRGTLRANFERQARRLPIEDEELGALYHAANVALRTAPVSLATAGAAVDAYVAALDRRLGLEGQGG